MDVLQAFVGDGVLALFALAGLASTAVAILRDTRSQREALERIPVKG
jgi:hypothetical protein